MPRTLSVAISLCLFSAPLLAASEDATLRPIQVTATRVAEDADRVPAAITTISATELRARGARDLADALALVAGVEISPGGDGGPAGSVPAFMGLREFDAFLLVVDGIPYGGAFNPQLTTVDLNNVERIEVMRGAAPVTFGATSFVGVIHVIHYAAGQAPAQVSGGFGSRGSAFAQGAINLSEHSTLSFNAEKRELAADDASYQRLQAQYRGAAEVLGGDGRLDLSVASVRQDPNSPHVRQGSRLTPLIPLDANHNPSDAQIDETRVQLDLGLERALDVGMLSLTGSLAHTSADLTRGFLTGLGTNPAVNNAAGYRQDRSVTDVYLDAHLSNALGERGHWTVGLDYLGGRGEQESENFSYFVPLDGRTRPSSALGNIDEFTELEDERNFVGLYAQADYALSDRLDLLAGVRLNHTSEDREGEEEVDGVDLPASDDRSIDRLTGHVGLSWRAYEAGADFVSFYVDYRNAFKPAAIDFGPEAEAEILDEETAEAWEIGVKQHWLDGRLALDLSAYQLDFSNLVVPRATADGRPGLENAGELNLDGIEAEMRYQVSPIVAVYGAWAYHTAEFGDYLRDFDGVPTQLRGNEQELVPNHLGALGLVLGDGTGLGGSLIYHYVGERYLNKRNSAAAGDYDTFDASVSWHAQQWDLALVGSNLTDKRPPISESELGDSQYYRLPARHVELQATYHF
ncbi:MAG: TonB-dependent receptor [Xanthomonadales bacterium]|nr:TonB-dependent receptor [Xanthomonadales bacterium]